ncbi:MAG: ABC transporter ATP-binding protein, partial [Roseburia sp.]|nr:ABC transporter ATP-binding protein [Roseburia sp.]
RVEDFVSMGVTAYLGAFSQPGQDDLRRAEGILRDLNCGHLVGRSMAKLSGGEQRMAYLARAVMQDADCLLLDEPVSALDLSRQHGFLGSLRRYVRSRQAGCLLTIHSPELAYAYAGRVLVLHNRQILLDALRDSADFDAQLSQALRTVYGPALRVSVLGGALVLGWDEPPAQS